MPITVGIKAPGTDLNTIVPSDAPTATAAYQYTVVVGVYNKLKEILAEQKKQTGLLQTLVNARGYPKGN